MPAIDDTLGCVVCEHEAWYAGEKPATAFALGFAIAMRSVVQCGPAGLAVGCVRRTVAPLFRYWKA